MYYTEHTSSKLVIVDKEVGVCYYMISAGYPVNLYVVINATQVMPS